MKGGGRTAGMPDATAVIPATSVVIPAPTDLPALQFFRRPAAGPSVRLYVVGDLGLSGGVAAPDAGGGLEALFGDVLPVLRTGDVVFGNLEYPLAAGVTGRSMFAAPPAGAEALAKAGFTLLHLANNHVAEHGLPGLRATLTALEAVGITPLGAGADAEAAQRLVRTDCNGIRIGWLGCGRTLEPQPGGGPRYWEFDEGELLTAVRQRQGEVDVLVVSIHIGLMYLDYPRPEHYEMAQRILEAGADLILMHHAHVLQGVQVTAAGRVCCYNLGNFLLDWREGNVEVPVMLAEQQQGAVFVFDLHRQGVAMAAAFPTEITADCRVTWARGDAGHRILERLARVSRALDGDFRAEFERQRAERNTGAILEVLAFHLKRGNLGWVVRRLARARREHVQMVARWLGERLLRTGR